MGYGRARWHPLLARGPFLQLLEHLVGVLHGQVALTRPPLMAGECALVYTVFRLGAVGGSAVASSHEATMTSASRHCHGHACVQFRRVLTCCHQRCNQMM
jgi:hypothetical protein